MSKAICEWSWAVLFALGTPLFAQQQFDSADAAAQAVIQAAERHDSPGLSAIFGPPGNAILSSSDPAQDRAEQSEFAHLARERHRVIRDHRDANRAILAIGDEDWPFPAPIVRSNGKWSFDASGTGVEMSARRIGTDELDAIEICAGYVDAQRRYASESHDRDGMLRYASEMSGSTNGLYAQGEARPLVPQGLAEATWNATRHATKPYHGYFFRILDSQGGYARGGAHNYTVKNRLLGGFGLVAWPAQYGVTGLHTFIVNQDGVIFEKDIAPVAGHSASTITRFDPDPSWKRVE